MLHELGIIELLGWPSLRDGETEGKEARGQKKLPLGPLAVWGHRPALGSPWGRGHSRSFLCNFCN